MKNTLLLLMLAPSFLLGQVMIQELCPGAVTNGTVVEFIAYQDELYATGFFNRICSENTDYMAKWDGLQWVPTDWGLSDPGHSFTVYDDKLFIARYEESIDSNWVYYYDGSQLNRMGDGVYLTTATGFSQLPNIYDLVEYQGRLIACGEFDRVGEEVITGIMQWNGTEWEALGSGLSGNIINTAPVMYPHQLFVAGGMLYVIGNFRTAGGLTVNGVAQWNGSSWSAMGEGFNSTVYAITVFQDELYVGGDFTASGSTALNRLAKWSGSEWVAAEFGFTPITVSDYSFIHTLEVIQDELYVSGGLQEVVFSDGTTAPVGGIVRFDGIELETFSGGVPGNDIEAIIPFGEQMLIGGGVFGTGYTGIIDFETGWETIEKNYSIHLYPNPVTTKVYWEFPIEDVVALEIKNSSGQVIHIASSTDLSNGQVDAELWESGVYFLSFKTAKGTIHEAKLVKI